MTFDLLDLSREEASLLAGAITVMVRVLCSDAIFLKEASGAESARWCRSRIDKLEALQLKLKKATE